MTKKKTYKVLDLFCGCGGISEGYALAGFDIVGGIDFNEYATITFQHNFKNARVHNIDITTFSNEQIADEYSDVGDRHVLILVWQERIKVKKGKMGDYRKHMQT